MTAVSESDGLISSLLDTFYAHRAADISLLETHISWVLLAGDYAYKIKKPVDLGFLDFRELSARRFFCEEEVRLNRRLAPQLYLGVVAIGGSARQPCFGIEPAIEYAVKMHRFPTGRQLDRLLAQGGLLPRHIDAIAGNLAAFHAAQPAAPADSAFGGLEAIAAPARQNFQQLASLLPSEYVLQLAELQNASEGRYASCLKLFEQRLQAGFVRECHGDLHLANLVLLDDGPVAFDCLEFDPKLRWIDVINDIAFLIMDLQQRGRSDLAFRFLNAYLQISGDYGGVGVLRFYLAYRAVVRAKISAIQNSLPDECCRYLRLAGDHLAEHKPALMIMHGLPGSGKTSISQLLLENTLAIRLRSDVERKRLFSFENQAELYVPSSTQHTYAQLQSLARQLLEFGFPVIVDATFLKYENRRQFRELAERMQLPFVVMSIKTDFDLLRRRVMLRQLQCSDASDADLAVVDKLQSDFEPMRPDEFGEVVEWVNDTPIAELPVNCPAWDKLMKDIANRGFISN